MRFSPRPCTRGRGAGGEGAERTKTPPPHPQPLSPEYRGEGSKKAGRSMPKKSALTPMWDSVRGQLRTGDLVLYAGGKGVFCSTIKRLTRSKWAHVGMVIRDATDEEPLLWESVMDKDMIDLETGEMRGGVRLVPLVPALTAYSGLVAVRHLTVKRTKKRLADLHDFRSKMRGVPFEKSRSQLLRANRRANRVEDISSVFCSELIAKAYMSMGLLSDDVLCNDYTPKDFTTDRDPSLLLRHAAILGPEIVVAR